MLTISNLTVRLGGRTILDGASASLPPRARIGLVGRNGAGKSTLMKVIAGSLEPDSGSVERPRGARLGYIAQDAPAGSGTPLEVVLAADIERAGLLAEEAQNPSPARLAEIHDRLIAIDAHAAPARAARILAGLGFDEAAQGRPLDSFSGGWRMRVALAALLFSAPDLMLLDEPSNHLDLEATLWLENFLVSCRATILVISHERDLLNKVVNHILHLEAGKLTLYAGGYDAFERQRAERLAQLATAREAEAAQRARLQEYIARNSARASTARQAQSRVKALARMQPVAEAATDPGLVFDFPSPQPLKPPLIQLEAASVGYEGRAVLSGLDLRLDPDERVALLGRNGNGKTTLARLLAGQLAPMAGGRHAPARLRVGYFTQYQVEELDPEDTPLQHMSRLMPGAAPSAVRAQLARFGFSGPRVEQKVGLMSGGERARLALALITREAPHLLILDEPTNHLDVDTREALVQALNGYEGAVVIVSHDRHMIEASADRLVLVDGGRAHDFPGDLDDYTNRLLGRDAPTPVARIRRKDDRRGAAEAREARARHRKAQQAAEAAMARHSARLRAIDLALFDPVSAAPADAGRTASELMQERAREQAALDAAEAAWLAAGEALEAAG